MAWRLALYENRKLVHDIDLGKIFVDTMDLIDFIAIFKSLIINMNPNDFINSILLKVNLSAHLYLSIAA
jgi:hypothetical protein